MKLEEWVSKFMGKVAAAVRPKAAPPESDPFRSLDRVAGVRDVDAEEELKRRREVNARGAQIRADRAAAVDLMLGGRSRWIPRRPGWLR